MGPAAVKFQILVLFTCLWLTARAAQASCTENCALCLLQLQNSPVEMDAMTCSLVCEGKLGKTKSLDLCKDVLQGDKAEMLTEGQVTMAAPNQEKEDSELAKKYGGFMKRYRAFMKKDTEGAADRFAILKELLNPEVEDKEEMAKQHGALMQSSKHSSIPDEEVKELQKRYGGFMRRVGRPAWKEDEKRYVGFLEAPQDKVDGDDLAGTRKQYEGFMD